MGRFDDIFFGPACQFIHVVQMIKPAYGTMVLPIKPYQLDPCGHKSISMTIQVGVNENIPSCRLDAAVISRFGERARQHDRCVATKMTMAGQAELVRYGLYARRDLAKP